MICKSCHDPSLVFVFGSNEAGVHGAGAARHALEHHGAVWGYGLGWGRHLKSFAIPTKDLKIKTLSLDRIRAYVETFIEVAKDNPEETFNVTRIGCGLAGYQDQDIAPMFAGAPANCLLPEGWRGDGF